MFTMASTKDFEFFERSEAFLSVLITDEYDPKILNMLSDNFDTFNKKLGHRWHLLIPYKISSYEMNDSLNQSPVPPSLYDETLSRRLQKFYSLTDSMLPAIVFDFNSGPIAFKIPEESRKIKIFFEIMSEGIDEFWFENNNSDLLRRRYISLLKKKFIINGIKRDVKINVSSPMTYVKLIPLLNHFLGGQPNE